MRMTQVSTIWKTTRPLVRRMMVREVLPRPLSLRASLGLAREASQAGIIPERIAARLVMTTTRARTRPSISKVM